jgi:membrane protein
MRIATVWRLMRDAALSWREDYAPSMGAALAYYTTFSAAPLLLIVVSVAGWVFGAEAARGEVFEQLRGMIGEEGALALQGLLQSVSKPAEGAFATVVGTVVLLIGATTVFAELQDALDRIWRAPLRDPRSGLWKLLRARVLSFGMILGIGFLLMVSLVVSAALAVLGRWWSPVFGGWAVLAQVANLVVSFGLITVIVAMIYKIMPRAHVQWRDVWIGASVTAGLFTVGKALIGLYIGRSGVASGFGAVGSLAVLLLWVYYSAQIFLLGAYFTWVSPHHCGSRRGMPRPGSSPELSKQTSATAPSRRAEP